MMAALAVRARPGIDQVAGPDVSPALGAGPSIVSKDSGVYYSRRLSDQQHDLAAAHGIPSQPAIFQNFASDGEAFIRRGSRHCARSPFPRAPPTARSKWLTSGISTSVSRCWPPL